MMAERKYIKATVRVASRSSREDCVTRVGRQGKTEVIKMTQNRPDKGKGATGLWGSRKVNYADRKVKEAYQKVNRMLGGR